MCTASFHTASLINIEVFKINLHSCATQRKKCGAHTHAHHLSLSLIQYSRRLLSILAQHKKIHTKHKSDFNIAFWYGQCADVVSDFYNKLDKRAQRKKNAEHTRMHTIFRAFFFSIFTSVVVYSRTPN